MNNKYNLYRVIIEERNDEQEYTHYVLVYERNLKQAEKKAHKLCKEWYGDSTGRNGEWYEFEYGCLIAKVDAVYEISIQNWVNVTLVRELDYIPKNMVIPRLKVTIEE